MRFERERTVAKTYAVAHDIVNAHVDALALPEDARQAYLETTATRIRSTYLCR